MQSRAHSPIIFNMDDIIGPYQIIRSIGKGGMGEVLLAYDTICCRKIALKRIRPDLLEYKQIYKRFLHEARITSHLTHPAIIPIYAIHQNDAEIYYTMPFVEGNTLKQILIQAKEQKKIEGKAEVLTGSIPYLIRIFLAICQAIAYAHSKSILHRDLKPENIIIGTYGEVLILDWGLAKLLTDDPQEDNEGVQFKSALHHTMAGKVVGTLGYMAPERALGGPATKETDIYSLGVILYQILTLKIPFRRKNLKFFRENLANEVLYDPIEVAPYRDIPKILAQICLKCLSPSPFDRYLTVDSLIRDLENYIEGRADWFQIADLKIENKTDWEFQEHILIAEHTAITRTAEISEWVELMISKTPFSGNIKIEARITPKKNCQGIGILFNIPELLERHQINEGFCLWISTEISRSTTLLRDSIEVLFTPDVFIQTDQESVITIEKIDNTIRLFINHIEQFSYISRMPLLGTHVGLLIRDTNFNLDPLKIWVGSQHIMVNCLSIPDAFLAHKDYQKALLEYRKIGQAFSGRAEGREALLRAGITLLEQAKSLNKEEYYDAALNEFEKLHGTAGAPLEYLGKALVYEHLQDYDEEVKCFELAYRRYPNHPLLHALQDQILFRLIETSRSDRKAVYQFLLLALCHIPNPLEIPALKNLISYLKVHWEPLDPLYPKVENDLKQKILTLAFWSHKNYVLEENAEEKNLVCSLSYLMLLNENTLANETFSRLPISLYMNEKAILSPLLSEDIDEAFNRLPRSYNQDNLFILSLFCDRAIDACRTDLVYASLKFKGEGNEEPFMIRMLWAKLYDGKFKEALQLIEPLPLEKLMSEKSLLHFLYGCLLFAIEGYEIAQVHWDSVSDEPLPRSWTLGSHYLAGKLDPSWYKKAFDWERWQLQRQLALFERIKFLLKSPLLINPID